LFTNNGPEKCKKTRMGIFSKKWPPGPFKGQGSLDDGS